jgi:hypothetical protein
MADPPAEWTFPKRNFIKASACNPVSACPLRRRRRPAAAWIHKPCRRTRRRSLTFPTKHAHHAHPPRNPPTPPPPRLQEFTEEDMEFQERIVFRSGLGDNTKCPPWLMGHPFFFDMAHARLEFEVTCFTAIEELLTRTGVSPKKVRGLPSAGCAGRRGPRTALSN